MERFILVECFLVFRQKVLPSSYWALSIQPKLSKIWKRVNGTGIAGKSFQKFRKLNANHSTENSESKVNGKKPFGKNNFSKIWVYLARLSSV